MGFSAFGFGGGFSAFGFGSEIDGAAAFFSTAGGGAVLAGSDFVPSIVEPAMIAAHTAPTPRTGSAFGSSSAPAKFSAVKKPGRSSCTPVFGDEFWKKK